MSFFYNMWVNSAIIGMMKQEEYEKDLPCWSCFAALRVSAEKDAMDEAKALKFDLWLLNKGGGNGVALRLSVEGAMAVI